MTIARHAAYRMYHRGLTKEALYRVIEQGKRVDAGGGRIKAMLNGTVVVMTPDEIVITAYEARKHQLLEFA